MFYVFAIFGCHNFTIKDLNQSHANGYTTILKYRLFITIFRFIFIMLFVIYYVFISRDRHIFTNSLVMFMQSSSNTCLIIFIIVAMLKFYSGTSRLIKFYMQVNCITNILSNEFSILATFSGVTRRTMLRILILLLTQTITVTGIAFVRKQLWILMDIVPIMYMLICVIFAIFQYDLSNVLLNSLHECMQKFHQNSRKISSYESWLLNISNKGLCHIKRRKLKVLQNIQCIIFDNLSILVDVNGPTILIFTALSIIAQIVSGYRVIMMLSENKGLDFALCE